MNNTRTNYRTNAFRVKFMNASKHLGAAPAQIASLKLRDMVASYSEYHDMLQMLEHEAGVQSSPIKDDLHGKGHLVTQDDQKIIVVEHETGLEILFIASSIASLIGLVPLVLQSWSAIRGHFNRRHANPIHNVEIRRVDAAGNLYEDHTHDNPFSSIFPLGVVNSAILSAAKILENDLKSLKEEVRSQSEQLAAIEKALTPPKRVATKMTQKKNSNKKLRRDEAKSHRAPL